MAPGRALMRYFKTTLLIYVAIPSSVSAGSIESKESEDLLESQMQKEPMLVYFDKLKQEDMTDPSTHLPFAKDFRFDVWMDFMRYYHEFLRKQPPFSFEPESLYDPEQLADLVLAEGSDEKEAHLNAVYLEGLCQMKDIHVVKTVLKRSKRKKLEITPFSGPITCLLKSFPRLSWQNVHTLIINAIRNPFVSNEEIIAAETAILQHASHERHEFLVNKHKDYLVEIFSSSRLSLFRHFLLIYLPARSQETLFENTWQQFLHFSHVLSAPATEKQRQIIQLYLMQIKSEIARKVCEQVSIVNGFHPSVVDCCERFMNIISTI